MSKQTNNSLYHYCLETKFPGNIVPRTDYNFLAKFIRVKDYDLDKAFQRLQKYYACVHRHMDFHRGLRPSDVKSALESKLYIILKHPCNGVKTWVVKVADWDPKVHSVDQLEKAGLFVLENYLSQVLIQENGASLILDLEGLRMEHLLHGTVRQIRRLIEVMLVSSGIEDVKLYN